MIQIPSDILTLSSEPTVLCRFGKLVFANRGAEELLGADCVGKNVKDLFGTVISEAQASTFLADVPVLGKHYILRVAHINDTQAIFFSRDRVPPILLNDAFVYSMRNCLMSTGIAADKGRLQAEQMGDRGLTECFTTLTKNHYVMLRLLSNISAIKGILDGTLPVTLSHMNLSHFIEELLHTLSILRKDIEFHVNVGGDLMIAADSALLELLMLNLISNCLVHADGLTRINVNLIEYSDNVVISVSDDGCGIKANELHSVFSRYCYGFDMRHLGNGSGFGLTVVRGIAEHHGGTVMLESREGSGTTVRASISKRLGSKYLREPQTPYSGNMQGILIGLADCLPDACFTDKFMD